MQNNNQNHQNILFNNNYKIISTMSPTTTYDNNNQQTNYINILPQQPQQQNQIIQINDSSTNGYTSINSLLNSNNSFKNIAAAPSLNVNTPKKITKT